MSISNRILLATSIIFAFVPFVLFESFVHLGLPLYGGLLFNPMNLGAYAWLVLTITYCWRTRSKKSLWLFIGFPIAFALQSTAFIEPANMLSDGSNGRGFTLAEFVGCSMRR
jgi:hypothetical protein